MWTSKSSRRERRPGLLVHVAAALAVAALIVACSDSEDPVVLPNALGATETVRPAGETPFDVVMSVLSSPRCTNCHPTDNRPRQTDLQAIHGFDVVRDATVQTCATCHHEENNEYSNVPGAPHWGLAPQSMGWLGLSDTALATVLLDTTANGDRSHEDLLEHMREDSLVLWAWEPGGDRNPPPVSHAEFVDALEAWFADGAPIPGEEG